MDIIVPEMYHPTATREIRQSTAWKKMPIIALTASGTAHDDDKCLAAGVNDCIARLSTLRSHCTSSSFGSKAEARMPSNDFDIDLCLLLEAIYRKYHFDFRLYSPASIRRCLTHALTYFSCRSFSVLQDRVVHEPEVFRRLFGFLTVQVSQMFRDPSYFKALRDTVVPFLQTYSSVKVWIPGCSAGEEAYSIAILLREEGLLDRTLIYATDINPDALRKAERGIYDLNLVAQFGASYRASGVRASLLDYCTTGSGEAMIDKTLREHILFSDHNLVTDHVFAEVQFISCRNVLIYFNNTLRARAVELFRDALCRRGFLGLGLRETLGLTSHAAAFEAFNREARIYRKL